MKITSAISTTLRSVYALSAMPLSMAFRTTSGLRSLPTIVVPGRAFLRARANEEPMRPRPTTATVAIPALRQLLHRAEQAPHVGHEAVEGVEIQRLRAV